MKQFPFISLFLIGILIYSCEKEHYSVQPESVAGNEVDFRSGQLPNGNGVQKINDNQTNPGLDRGIGVSIPIFSEETVVVKAGTWVTLRFGLGDEFSEGLCPEKLTDEDIEFILSDAIKIIEDEGIEIEFDGEPIDIAPYFRTAGIALILLEENTCRYVIPWRYYVTPRSIGDHEFTFRFDGEEFTRTITWLPEEDDDSDE